MADGPENTQVSAVATDEADALLAWRSLWQIPALTISLVLIVVGLMQLRPTVAEPTVAEWLASAEGMIAEGRLTDARQLLQQQVEPRLAADDIVHRAHFHALVADWLAVQQEMRGSETEREQGIVVEQFRIARDLGRTLEPSQLERFAAAMIALGRVTEARALMHDLDQYAASDADHPQRRSRLLRRLAVASLNSDELRAEERLEIVERFRRESSGRADDVAWALAREAEIRLAEGDAEEAVTGLLIGMRRLESMRPEAPPLRLGELYTLLADGHRQAGRCGDAAIAATRADGLIPPGHVGRFALDLIRARCAVAEGDGERAVEYTHRIIDEGIGSRSWAAGLLLHGEVMGMIGESATSIDTFRRLQGHMDGRDVVDGVRAVDAAASLVDRHDASLLTGDFDLAMQFLDAAHAFFAQHAVPEIVLERTAATARGLADRMMAAAMEEAGEDASWMDVPAPVRRHAMHAYERAAASFERLARARQLRPDDSGGWAESLRLAGESHDLAGRPDRAIDRFRDYLDQYRVERDPYRSQVLFMLGQSLSAERRFDEAIDAFAKVLEIDPNIVGTRTHVPLARARVAAGRLDEAIRGLERVVEGRGAEAGPLTPEAADHQAALVELAIVLHEAARRVEGDAKESRQLLVRALERLTESLERQPLGPRVTEMTYRIADVHRRIADLEDEWLERTAVVAPSERRRRESVASEHRRQAVERYAVVAAELGARPPDRLTPLEREMQRGAWLGRADALYALSAYAEAVRLYDRAARMFGDEPEAVAALIQVINSYDRLGRPDLAEAAHRFALERMAAMPDRVFSDPRSLMSRRAWEEWMANRPVGIAAVQREDLP